MKDLHLAVLALQLEHGFTLQKSTSKLGHYYTLQKRIKLAGIPKPFVQRIEIREETSTADLNFECNKNINALICEELSSSGIAW